MQGSRQLRLSRNTTSVPECQFNRRSWQAARYSFQRSRWLADWRSKFSALWTSMTRLKQRVGAGAISRCRLERIGVSSNFTF